MSLKTVVRVGARCAVPLLLALAAPGIRAQQVAIVIDVAGKAEVEEKSGRHHLRLLESLPAGTRLSIGQASKVDLLYVKTGAQFSASGPSLVELAQSEVTGIIGTMPVRQPIAEGSELRLRRDRVVQGGIVLRSPDPPAAASVAAPKPSELQRRRPPKGAPFARRVAYALWLEDVGAQAEAREAWRLLAKERPSDESIARRAR
ncbi:hypothetical protein [Aquabacterium humicola]|uniref:hypothetical protein n=1 Tax=Aquabacterium humicola TaxID=3237377 RepID=UPI00254385EF|nr:hypothetical protein [Rubrivivax pictus]